MHFEWDEEKNAANLLKHGIGFDEAATVFYDDAALLYDDPDSSDEEERYILLGLSGSLRVVVVVHCVRGVDEIIRIISARKATRSERAAYGGAS